MPGVVRPEIGYTAHCEGDILRGQRDYRFVVGRLNHDIRCAERQLSERSAAGEGRGDDLTQERKELQILSIRLPELGRSFDPHEGVSTEHWLELHSR